MRFIQHLTYGSYVPPHNIRKINNVRQKTVVWDIEAGLIEKLANDLWATDSIEVNVGISVVHPDDEYNKKKGIAHAEANMKPVAFKLTSVNMSERGVDGRHLRFNAVAKITVGKGDHFIILEINYRKDTKKLRSVAKSNDIF